MFELVFTHTADKILKELEDNPAKKGLVKQVKKSLGFLQVNPKHPSLNTHSYDAIQNFLVLWTKKRTNYYYCHHSPSLGLLGSQSFFGIEGEWKR